MLTSVARPACRYRSIAALASSRMPRRTSRIRSGATPSSAARSRAATRRLTSPISSAGVCILVSSPARAMPPGKSGRLSASQAARFARPQGPRPLSLGPPAGPSWRTSMQSRLVALSCAAAGLPACALGNGGTPPGAPGALNPPCADAEMDACVAESVTVSAQSLPSLDSSDVGALLADRRPGPVRCILRETGAIEACHVLTPRGPPFDASIESYLQQRRYTPVAYKGKPVLVPYTFLVSFNPPPAELARVSGVRIEVFRALLFRLRGPVVDAGTEARPLVCVGSGDAAAG